MECDLTQNFVVLDAIKEIKPDILFHLAAQSFVPDSWKDPHQTVESNIFGMINILEAVKKHSPRTNIFVCGTAEEYGLVDKSERSIREETPLVPNNPYGATKVAQELFAKIACQSYGARVCLARPFAHEGPRRGKEFAASDFALQLVAIEKGLRKKPVIYYGCLDTVRDYTHVKDMVRMYWELMHNFKPGVAYNVCRGKETTIKELVETFIEVSGLKKIRMELHPKLVRPTQASYLVGNPDKLFSQIDFRPKLALKDICKDVLAYWRKNFEPLSYWDKNK